MSTEFYYLLFSLSIITFLTIASLYKEGEGYCKFFLWLTMTLFTGLRVGLGRDYSTYLTAYTDPLSDTFVRYEPLWQLIINFYHSLHLPFHFWLLTAAGLTYYVLFRALKAWKINWILGILAYILIYKGFFESLSAIRQSLAIVFVLWGMAHLYGKSYWKFALLVLLGGLFHRSAFLCWFILPLLNIKWNRTILIGGLLASLFVGLFFFKDLLFLFKGVMPATYQVYLEDMALWKTESSTGIFRIFLNLIALAMLIFAYKKTDEEDGRLSFFVRMLVGSICIYNICFSFEPAMRLMTYPFTCFFVFIPLGLLYKGFPIIRILACTTLLGFAVFTIKDISAPEETFAHYQTILNETYPKLQLKSNRGNMDLDDEDK